MTPDLSNKQLSKKGIDMYFQPIFFSQNDALVSYEDLARWH